jgi:hypothetical protein
MEYNSRKLATTKIAKRLLTGTKPTYEEKQKREKKVLVGCKHWPQVGPYSLQKLFLCFFVFVVCRFCTSKRSFGYVFLDLARCVFIEVFVHDWPKPKFGWRVFGGPRSPKTFHVLGDSKRFTKTLQCCGGCLDLAMPLGLSNFQIFLTILAIYHLTA